MRKESVLIFTILILGIFSSLVYAEENTAPLTVSSEQTTSNPISGCQENTPSFTISPTLKEGNASDTLTYDLIMKDEDIGCAHRWFSMWVSSPIVPPNNMTLAECYQYLPPCMWHTSICFSGATNHYSDGWCGPTFKLDSQENAVMKFNLTSKEGFPDGKYIHYIQFFWSPVGEETNIHFNFSIRKNLTYQIGSTPSICPKGCICQGDTITCPIQKTCPINCICKEDTMTCPELPNEEIKEQVTCLFSGSNSVQKCYSSDSQGRGFSCTGEKECFAVVLGIKGEKLTWKSSCGGYAYTIIDGNNEKVKFDCSTTTTPTPPPNYTSIWFRNAYWQCYDGRESKEGGESSCKPVEVWKKYAEDFCREKCKSECKKYDFNEDGICNEKDMQIIRAHIGKPTTVQCVKWPCTYDYDINKNGEINSQDLLAYQALLKEGFGGKCGVNTFQVFNECGGEIERKPVCGNDVCEAGEGEICEAILVKCEEGKKCESPPAKCKTVCPEDCKKKEIYVNLDEKFKLQKSEIAIFKLENSALQIKFNDLWIPKCGGEEETTTTPLGQAETGSADIPSQTIATGYAVEEATETIASSSLVGEEAVKCSNLPIAVLQVKYERDGKEKTEVIKVLINQKRIVFDFVVGFLDFDATSKTGVFLVSKAGEINCPWNCVCNEKGNILKCKEIKKCPEGLSLCQDGICREKCEVINITRECKYGCFYQGKCLPYGLRVEGMYCAITNDMKSQAGGDEKCENNFECKTNVCVDGKCLSSGFIQKILSWFRKLFGGE